MGQASRDDTGTELSGPGQPRLADEDDLRRNTTTRGLGTWYGRVGWCYIFVSLDFFKDGRPKYLYIVLGGCMRILA